MFTDARNVLREIDSPRACVSSQSRDISYAAPDQPGRYDELHRAVLQVVSTGPAAQRYNERYGATAATRQEEMLADMYGDFMDDPNSCRGVPRLKAPLVERIYQGVDKRSTACTSG